MYTEFTGSQVSLTDDTLSDVSSSFSNSKWAGKFSKSLSTLAAHTAQASSSTGSASASALSVQQKQKQEEKRNKNKHRFQNPRQLRMETPQSSSSKR